MIRQLFEAIARRGLASGISLATTSYLAHQFATLALGTFLGMLALAQLLVMFFSAGLEISPTYMLRKHPGHTKRIWLISTAASLTLATGCLLFGAASVAVAPQIGATGSRFLEWGIAPFVSAAAIIVLVPQLACLQGLLRLRSYNVLQVVFPFSFLLMVVAVDHSISGLTPRITIYLWAAAGVLTATAAALLLLTSVLEQPESKAEVITFHRNAFLGFSLQSYLANCIGTLNSRLPIVVAPLVLTPVAASQFAGAIFLGEIFSLFSFAIASVTFPLLAGVIAPSDRVDKLGRACRLNTSVTLLAVVTFLLLFEPLCGLLLGPSFLTPDFRLMASVVTLCTVAHSTARLLCTDFAAQGKPLMSALPNIPAAILFAVSFVILCAWAEPWGVVLSYCASSLCFSMMTFLLYRRRFKIDVAAIGLATFADAKAALAAIQRLRRRQWN